MNTKNKKNTIIVIIIVSLLILSVISMLDQKTQPPQTNILPTPTIFKSQKAPTTNPLGKERDAQQNFANERGILLQEKPWLLMLPIKSWNYFISYDSEKDEFLVNIYYFQPSSISVHDQIIKAKNDALLALKSFHINADVIKITYFYTAKKVVIPAP